MTNARIEAAASEHGLRLELTAAVSTESDYIGSLGGSVNLNIFIGEQSGVVGRAAMVERLGLKA